MRGVKLAISDEGGEGGRGLLREGSIRGVLQNRKIRYVQSHTDTSDEGRGDFDSDVS